MLAFLFAVLIHSPARATAPPSLLHLHEVERLSPNDQNAYFRGLQDAANRIAKLQFKHFREGWSEPKDQPPAPCAADGVITRTEAFQRPPSCRQYEKSVDGLLRKRFCWTARRHCPTPAHVSLGGREFRCPLPVQRPCHPLIYGFDGGRGKPARPHCTRPSDDDAGECVGRGRGDRIAKSVRALGLTSEFDHFAATGFSPLCAAPAAARVLTDQDCAFVAKRLGQLVSRYRGKADGAAE